MRTAFICSGLELGRDGVGDYTRRLAGELYRQEHEAAILVLNDTTTLEMEDGVVEIEGEHVPVLRLSRLLPWSERRDRAARWVRDFRADWISVQFVCFGYHPKGLALGLPAHFGKIVGSTPVHWMFHELWVGREKGHPWKFRAWGALQRFIAVKAHRRISPRVTHTTIESYATTLRRCGIQAEVLPVFSNIPISCVSGPIAQDLESIGISDRERTRWVLLGIFGTIQPGPSANDWLDDLVGRAAAIGRRVAILGIGRLDPVGREKFVGLGRGRQKEIFVHHFGARPAEQISEFLQAVDGGIATTERSALGKSGTAAAMREHDLPILAVRGELGEAAESVRVRVRADIDRLLAKLDRIRRPQGERLLRATADRLVRRLQAASTGRSHVRQAGGETGAAIREVQTGADKSPLPW